MAGNCHSLLGHLSGSHLLNRIKINQWLLVFAAAAVTERMASSSGVLRSGLGPPPAAAVMTPYNPNGLLHATLT